MDFEKNLTLGVVFAYSLGAFGILLGTLATRRAMKTAANILTLAGFFLHSLSLLLIFLSSGMEGFSSGYYPRLLAWCLIFLYLGAWRWLRLPFLGLTAAPLALLLYILSMRLSGGQNPLPEHLSGLFFGLHIWSLYLSLGLLAMAFGAGLLFIPLEGRLKKKARPTEFTRDMPSIATLDKVNMAAVMGGFPLYTLGLMSGFLWAPMARDMVENPKVILSLFVWFLYALLFYQRTALGYRGRKTAVMAILIFSISALSFTIDYALFHHSSRLLP